VDASASGNGRYFYVQTGGNGVVDEFYIGANGSLAALGSVAVAGAVGVEDIVTFLRSGAPGRGPRQVKRPSPQYPPWANPPCTAKMPLPMCWMYSLSAS
jgi:hypothetical protein